MFTLMSVVPSFSVASVYNDIDHLLLRLMIAMRVCLTALQLSLASPTATQLLLIPAATTPEQNAPHAHSTHAHAHTYTHTHSDTTYTTILG